MIEKDSVETFLSIVATMDTQKINKVFGTYSINELLFNIDIEKRMAQLFDYLNEKTAGDRVQSKSTGETGTILFIKDDRANVVMDAFTTLEEQVKTFDITDLEKKV